MAEPLSTLPKIETCPVLQASIPSPWIEKLKQWSRYRPVLLSLVLLLLTFLVNKLWKRHIPLEIKNNDDILGKEKIDSHQCSPQLKSDSFSSGKVHSTNKSSDNFNKPHMSNNLIPSYSKTVDRSIKRKKLTMPSLIALVGIPGSGKSTWGAQYKERVRNNSVIISSDEIRIELTGSVKDRSRDEEVRAIILERVNQLVSKKETVIVDDCTNNLDPGFREELLKAVDHLHYETVVRKFHLNPTLADARIQNDIQQGKNRYIPSFPELQKNYQQYLAAEQSIPLEGWEKIKG